MVHVLVVATEKGLGEGLRELLQARGHGVSLAGDAESALRLAATESPRAILVDMRLPELSGYDLVRILRKTPPHLQSWVASFGAHRPDPQRYEDADINACVSRDCTAEELLAALLASPGSPLH